MSSSYTLSPPKRLHGVSAFVFFSFRTIFDRYPLSFSSYSSSPLTFFMDKASWAFSETQYQLDIFSFVFQFPLDFWMYNKKLSFSEFLYFSFFQFFGSLQSLFRCVLYCIRQVLCEMKVLDGPTYSTSQVCVSFVH